jgi:hypothetical protein
LETVYKLVIGGREGVVFKILGLDPSEALAFSGPWISFKMGTEKEMQGDDTVVILMFH